jgi:hypothetical protein
MWNQDSGRFGFDPSEEPAISERSGSETRERARRLAAASSNSPDDVLGEVGLVLVVILGIVLVINAALVALHVA